MVQEVRKMIEEGALEVVSDQSPGFYNHLLLVEKTSY